MEFPEIEGTIRGIEGNKSINILQSFVFVLQSNITIEYTSTPLSAMTGNQ